MKKILIPASGWIVAAAFAALWLGLRDAASSRDSQPDAPQADSVCEETETSGQPPAVTDDAAPRLSGGSVANRGIFWRPARRWDVYTLHSLLSGAPAYVMRVADAIKDACTPVDAEKLIAIVQDAARCPNPIVRAMMADALLMAADLPSMSISKEKQPGLLIDAAKVFVLDSNGFVSARASHAIFAALREIADAGERMAAFEGAVVDTDSKFIEAMDGESGKWWSLQGRLFDGIERGDDTLAAFAAAVERSIERLPPGEGRKSAEALYASLTGAEYAGPGSAEKYAGWRKELVDAGKAMYDEEWKRKSFAASVDEDTRSSASALEQFDEDVQEAGKMFKLPQMAVKYARMKEDLRSEAVERYGDTETAAAWLEEEDKWLKFKLKAADKAVSKYENNKLGGRVVETRVLSVKRIVKQPADGDANGGGR